MDVKKISLDMRESSKTMRILQLIFGLVCLFISAWLFSNLMTTKSASGSNLIAVVFLFFFGIWELLSAFGITGRYIIVSDEKIILKHKYISRPQVHTAAKLKTITIKPVAFELHHLNGSKTLVKLGLYYRERSAEILDAVESFCKVNNIAVEGLEEETN